MAKLEAAPSHREKDAQAKHKPTTDIIDRIKKATPKMEILTFVKTNKEIANDILTLNRQNRDVYLADVEKHAFNMKNKKWFFTGQVIRVDEDMRLIDGQHELLAVDWSDTEQVFHIQCGIDREAFSVIDTGRVKSLYDALRTAGYKDVYNLGSAVRTVITLTKFQKTAGNYKGGLRVDNLECISWIKNTSNAKLCDKCLHFTDQYLRTEEEGRFLTKTIWAAILYIFSKLDPNAAELFCTKLANGEGLVKDSKDSAIYLLRRKLLWFNAKRENRPHGARSKDFKYRYIFHAWNLWREKKIVSELNPDMESATIEKPI